MLIFYGPLNLLYEEEGLVGFSILEFGSVELVRGCLLVCHLPHLTHSFRFLVFCRAYR